MHAAKTIINANVYSAYFLRMYHYTCFLSTILAGKSFQDPNPFVYRKRKRNR